MKGKVLRAKDKLHVRPNPAELKALRQGEPTDNERRLENKIPKHLPLKVKIKRDKLDKFKDLANEHWARDLELEVTNTGQKPIYFVEFLLILPEVTAPSGLRESFSPYYGRDDLGSFENKAEDSDVPILPGETVVLTIDVRNVAGYEAGNRKWQRQPPKRVELTFQMLNFGDGTGFLRSDGSAVPSATGTPSSACMRNKGDPFNNKSKSDWSHNYSNYSPAMLFSVNFLFVAIDAVPIAAVQDTAPCCAPDGFICEDTT